MKHEIVVIGSSSELATRFIKLCLEKSEFVVSISRSEFDQIKTSHHIQIEDYFEDYLIIENEVRKLSNPTLIFFNGFLAENRNFQFPTKDEISKTDEINFVLPYFLSRKLNMKLENISKFIYISSNCNRFERLASSEMRVTETAILKYASILRRSPNLGTG